MNLASDLELSKSLAYIFTLGPWDTENKVKSFLLTSLKHNTRRTETAYLR